MRHDIHVHARRAGWLTILRSLSVPEEVINGKHQPCPLCGGEDRFRLISSDDGRWICNQCRPESGSGFDLLMAIHGWTFKQTVNKVRGAIGVVEPLTEYHREEEKRRKKEEWASKKDRLMKLWASGEPIPGTMAADYLFERGINMPGMTGVVPADVDDLRFTYTTGSGVPNPMPCMLAAIRDKRGYIVSIHRTFLEDFGWMGTRKADIESPRQVMPPLGTISGAAVRLSAITDDVLGIAEGIETALSAGQLNDVPVWACLNANGIRSFEPPDGLRKLLVFADRDRNGVGQSAAYELALKYPVITEVLLPEGFGDWNEFGDSSVDSGGRAVRPND